MWHRPIIDSSLEPDDYAAFLSDRLNPKACPSCSLPMSGETPTTVRTPNWVGIALENPSPIPVSTAHEIVATLTKPLFDVDSPDAPPVLLVGRSEELRRIITNKKGDPFCAITLDLMQLPNHGILIQVLSAISDAYLDSDIPEGAYWIFPEAIAEFNELYFHRLVYELVELTACAAGDRIFRYLNTPQRVGDHFRGMQRFFEPYRAKVSGWGRSVHFCFYEKGPHKSWPGHADAGTSLVELVQLAPGGSLDIDAAERHLAFVPLQAIVHQEPPPERKAFGEMLAVMLGSNAVRHLGKLPEDAQSLLELAARHFQILWSNLRSIQKQELAERYCAMTGGKDLRDEFQLK